MVVFGGNFEENIIFGVLLVMYLWVKILLDIVESNIFFYRKVDNIVFYRFIYFLLFI